MHTSVYWLPKVYKPRGEVINNNMFTKDWKCARSHAMSWYNTHHLPSPICLPQQGKHRPQLAAQCLCPPVFQEHPRNRLQRVLWESWMTNRPLRRDREMSGPRRCRHCWSFDWQEVDSWKSLQSANKSHPIQRADQGRMTLKMPRWPSYSPSWDTLPEQEWA